MKTYNISKYSKFLKVENDKNKEYHHIFWKHQLLIDFFYYFNLILIISLLSNNSDLFTLFH